MCEKAEQLRPNQQHQSLTRKRRSSIVIMKPMIMAKVLETKKISRMDISREKHRMRKSRKGARRKNCCCVRCLGTLKIK